MKLKNLNDGENIDSPLDVFHNFELVSLEMKSGY